MVTVVISIAICVWAYFQFLSPRATALERLKRNVFRPVEVGETLLMFGKLCQDMIQLTPAMHRGTIAIRIYVGETAGGSCPVSVSFTNFSHRNIRDMLQAYQYVERLGWEENPGSLTFVSERVDIGYEWLDYAEKNGKPAMYEALIRCFRRYCPSAVLQGPLSVTEDGVFQMFSVIS